MEDLTKMDADDMANAIYDAGISDKKNWLHDVMPIVAELNRRDALLRRFQAAFGDEKGEPRKVLGTLPVLGSGEFAGWGEWQSFVLRGNRREVCGPYETHNGWRGWSGPTQATMPEDCFSTREAAQSARAGEGNPHAG